MTDSAARQHDHDGCGACRDEHYQQAKDDPVASVVLDSMHRQDAATYNGSFGWDMGAVALAAADTIRERLKVTDEPAAGRVAVVMTTDGPPAPMRVSLMGKRNRPAHDGRAGATA